MYLKPQHGHLYQKKRQTEKNPGKRKHQSSSGEKYLDDDIRRKEKGREPVSERMQLTASHTPKKPPKERPPELRQA
jgi:hypothetical protein